MYCSSCERLWEQTQLLFAILFPFRAKLSVLSGDIVQTTFSNALSWMKLFYLELNFTEICFQWSNWQKSYHWIGAKPLA